MADSLPAHSTRFRIVHAASVTIAMLGALPCLLYALKDGPVVDSLIVSSLTLLAGHLALATRRRACRPTENSYAGVAIFGVVCGYLGVIAAIFRAYQEAS